jgi:hypothetical protein
LKRIAAIALTLMLGGCLNDSRQLAPEEVSDPEAWLQSWMHGGAQRTEYPWPLPVEDGELQFTVEQTPGFVRVVLQTRNTSPWWLTGLHYNPYGVPEFQLPTIGIAAWGVDIVHDPEKLAGASVEFPSGTRCASAAETAIG